MQLHLLLRELRRLPGPHVLVGDLNLPGPLPAALTGWASLGRAATFPAPAPRIQLDHALAHGLDRSIIRAAAVTAVELPVSDHRALVIDLQLAGPASPIRAASVKTSSVGASNAANSSVDGKEGRETRPSLT